MPKLIPTLSVSVFSSREHNAPRALKEAGQLIDSSSHIPAQVEFWLQLFLSHHPRDRKVLTLPPPTTDQHAREGPTCLVMHPHC